MKEVKIRHNQYKNKMTEFKKKDMIIDFGSFNHPVIVYQNDSKNEIITGRPRNNLSVNLTRSSEKN